MSLGSEARSEDVARSLEKVLKKGLETEDPKIIKFLRENIYPLYEIHSGEGNYSGDPEISKSYT